MICSSCWFISHPLSCVPWLHGRYPLPRYYGRSDSRPAALGAALRSGPKHRLSLAGLPDDRVGISGPSVSRHRRDDRGPPGCPALRLARLAPALQASPVARRLARPRQPNRVHVGRPAGQPVLRTGRSRSGALHPALRRRSSGSIPHGSSPHRSGLPPLRLPAFSGARAHAPRVQFSAPSRKTRCA